MEKGNSPNKKEDNRSVNNKKLSINNNTSNSKLDDVFHSCTIIQIEEL